MDPRSPAPPPSGLRADTPVRDVAPARTALPGLLAVAPGEAPPLPARRALLRTLGGAGLLLSGCGGTELAGVGSGGTGQIAATPSYSSGAITGFGSVIVNGIRYDDSAASVTDEFGATRSLDELAIGMVVDVEGTADDATAVGTARTIRVLSELRGPVASIDRAAGRFVVLGTVVQASAATVWDDLSGPGALTVGRAVEVWGHADRESGVLRATRVEAGGAAGRAFVLRGVVSELDRAAGTLRIGPQRVDVRRVVAGPGQPAAAVVLAALADGAIAVAAAASAPAAIGAWLVDRIVAIAPAAALQAASARLDGRIAALAPGLRFEVAGVSVDAGGAELRGGTAASLRAGVRVRVTGNATAGRVVARLVEIRSDGADTEEDENEVRGSIVRIGANPADFTIRDSAGRQYVVAAGAAVLEDGLRLADLRIGTRLEVRGRGSLLIVATRIRSGG